MSELEKYVIEKTGDRGVFLKGVNPKDLISNKISCYEIISYDSSNDAIHYDKVDPNTFLKSSYDDKIVWIQYPNSPFKRILFEYQIFFFDYVEFNKILRTQKLERVLKNN